MGIKKTQEEFLEQAKKVHGDKYIYDKVEYTGNSNKVIIICPDHGEFFQTPHKHLFGQGCRKCWKENLIAPNKDTIETFIQKARLAHGVKYDYSNAIYIDSSTPLEIICYRHGSFKKAPNVHLSHKQGCPKCTDEREKKWDNLRILKQKEIFINKSREVHKELYTYELVEYKNNVDKVLVTCSLHGSFYVIPNNHLHGQGCPSCKMSKGERATKDFLDSIGIKYTTQEWFENSENQCRNYETNYPLRFDFYLSGYNLCIEIDGEAHYKPMSFGSDQSEENKNKNLEETIKRDMIKNQYCRDNGIGILRIPYWDFSRIEDIISIELDLENA